MQNEAIILKPGEGKEISVGNSKLFYKLMSSSTDQKFTITEYELPAGFPGPPKHKHKEFEHAWYILEGTLHVEIDNDAITVTEGGFVFIPKKTSHAFSNQTDSLVRLLAIDTPGGFEKYYEEIQVAFSGGRALDPDTFKKIQLKYDTYPPDHLFD